MHRDAADRVGHHFHSLRTTERRTQHEEITTRRRRDGEPGRYRPGLRDNGGASPCRGDSPGRVPHTRRPLREPAGLRLRAALPGDRWLPRPLPGRGAGRRRSDSAAPRRADLGVPVPEDDPRSRRSGPSLHRARSDRLRAFGQAGEHGHPHLQVPRRRDDQAGRGARPAAGDLLRPGLGEPDRLTSRGRERGALRARRPLQCWSTGWRGGRPGGLPGEQCLHAVEGGGTRR